MHSTMFRFAIIVAAAAAACSGGGGSAPAAQPAPDLNPAPAPGPAPGIAIDLNGLWMVTQTTINSTNTTSPTPVPVGNMVLIQNGAAVAFGTQSSAASLRREDLESTLGFPLDWYTNSTTPATGDFGYGWDRLRVPGGGGQFSDYVQYGFRVAAVTDDVLVAYEAEFRQDYLGVARTEWIAWHLLSRQ